MIQFCSSILFVYVNTCMSIRPLPLVPFIKIWENKWIVFTYSKSHIWFYHKFMTFATVDVLSSAVYYTSYDGRFSTLYMDIVTLMSLVRLFFNCFPLFLYKTRCSPIISHHWRFDVDQPKSVHFFFKIDLIIYTCIYCLITQLHGHKW